MKPFKGLCIKSIGVYYLKNGGVLIDNEYEIHPHTTLMGQRQYAVYNDGECIVNLTEHGFKSHFSPECFRDAVIRDLLS